MHAPQGDRVTIRARRADDLPGLAALLSAQQEGSGYPMRWPLPFPVEQFLVRETEERAWVAEVDGALAGHVALTRPTGEIADALARYCPGQETTEMSVLFTGPAHRGTGVGGRLHDAAVAAIRDQQRLPALDVLPAPATAIEFYRRRGWHPVATLRPDWLPAAAPDVILMVLPPA